MKIPSHPTCPECQNELESIMWSDVENVLRCNYIEKGHKMKRYDIYYHRETEILTSAIIDWDLNLLFVNYYSYQRGKLKQDNFVDLNMFLPGHPREDIHLNSSFEIDWFNLDTIERKIQFLLTFQ